MRFGSRFGVYDVLPGVAFGSGGSTNTVTSNSAPPAYVQQAEQGVYSDAQSAASNPYQYYTGNMVAGLSPDQEQAIATTANAQGMYGDYGNAAENSLTGGMSAASGYTNAAGQAAQSGAQTASGYLNNAGQMVDAAYGAANPYLNSASQSITSAEQPISAQQIQQYENPYQQQAINSTVAEMQNTNAQQQTALEGNAISNGAFGNDRMAVTQAALANQQDLAMNQTVAGMENQNYSQALSAAQQNQANNLEGGFEMGNLGQEALNAGLSSAQAESGLGTQALGIGTGLANEYGQLGSQALNIGATGAQDQSALGTTALNNTLTGAQAQFGMGTAEQAQQQNSLNAAYQQWLSGVQYPFQTSQYLGDIVEGIGGIAGGSSSSMYPSPSSLSQVAGLATSGVGLYNAANNAGLFSSGSSGASGAVDSGDWDTARGGRIPEHAAGGKVSLGDAPRFAAGGYGQNSTSTTTPGAGQEIQSAVGDVSQLNKLYHLGSSAYNGLTNAASTTTGTAATPAGMGADPAGALTGTTEGGSGASTAATGASGAPLGTAPMSSAAPAAASQPASMGSGAAPATTGTDLSQAGTNAIGQAAADDGTLGTVGTAGQAAAATDASADAAAASGASTAAGAAGSAAAGTAAADAGATAATATAADAATTAAIADAGAAAAGEAAADAAPLLVLAAAGGGRIGYDDGGGVTPYGDDPLTMNGKPARSQEYVHPENPGVRGMGPPKSTAPQDPNYLNSMQAAQSAQTTNSLNSLDKALNVNGTTQAANGGRIRRDSGGAASLDQAGMLPENAAMNGQQVTSIAQPTGSWAAPSSQSQTMGDEQLINQIMHPQKPQQHAAGGGVAGPVTSNPGVAPEAPTNGVGGGAQGSGPPMDNTVGILQPSIQTPAGMQAAQTVKPPSTAPQAPASANISQPVMSLGSAAPPQMSMPSSGAAAGVTPLGGQSSTPRTGAEYAAGPTSYQDALSAIGIHPGQSQAPSNPVGQPVMTDSALQDLMNSLTGSGIGAGSTYTPQNGGDAAGGAVTGGGYAYGGGVDRKANVARGLADMRNHLADGGGPDSDWVPSQAEINAMGGNYNPAAVDPPRIEPHPADPEGPPVVVNKGTNGGVTPVNAPLGERSPMENAVTPEDLPPAAPAPKPSLGAPQKAPQKSAIPENPDSTEAGILRTEGSSNGWQVNPRTHASGPLQITPGTFYDNGGKDFNNHDEVMQVSQKLMNKYQQMYPNDPARVAVAWQSGPGNVRPVGQPGTPWLEDRTDGNMHVSQYVSSVMGRRAAIEQNQLDNAQENGGNTVPGAPPYMQTGINRLNDISQDMSKAAPQTDVPQQTTIEKIAESPWMALVKAGAGMMAGTSPFAGVNIGRGIEEGADYLQSEGGQQRQRQGLELGAKQANAQRTMTGREQENQSGSNIIGGENAVTGLAGVAPQAQSVGFGNHWASENGYPQTQVPGFAPTQGNAGPSALPGFGQGQQQQQPTAGGRVGAQGGMAIPAAQLGGGPTDVKVSPSAVNSYDGQQMPYDVAVARARQMASAPGNVPGREAAQTWLNQNGPQNDAPKVDALQQEKNQAAQMTQNIATLNAAAQQAYTGTGAMNVANINKVLSSVGSVLNLDLGQVGNNATAAQIIEKETAMLQGMQARSAGDAGGSALYNSVAPSVPSLGNTPQAVQQIGRIFNSMADRSTRRATFITNAVQSGKMNFAMASNAFEQAYPPDMWESHVNPLPPTDVRQMKAGYAYSDGRGRAAVYSGNPQNPWSAQ